MTKLTYPHSQGVDANEQLRFIAETFGLSETELGRLLHVTRQSVTKWRERGIPPKRSAQVDRIVEVAQFLQRRLIPARIPEIVRTPAKGLEGATMLSVLRDQGAEAIFLYVTRLAANANS